MPAYRVERDSMGEVRVPEGARYGAQTQRAVENFPVSGVRLERRMIWALALIKAEAARVNARLSAVERVTPAVGRAIAEAAEEVAEGRWDDHFPVDVFQTGSGTSSHMNLNEVLASLASEKLGEPVHPNDQINACQSSNDVFPSAIHLAATDTWVRDLRPALLALTRSLRAKAREFAHVVKPGRTHLMDATPVTLGQELSGFAAQIRQAVERLDDGLPRLAELPLGGTATGTGLNAPREFAPRVLRALRARTGLPLSRARDPFAAQSARDGLVEASAGLRGLAVALLKITHDLRWMGSGPRAGLGELRLPELQPGSSIMPGKVNPVVPEAVAQVSVQVIGHDATIAFAGSQGAFELNTFMPLMARCLLESMRILASACRLLATRCVRGLEADAERCRAAAERSPAIATALAPHLGYDETARVVAQALADDRPIRDVVLERGLMSRREIERVLNLEAMARGERG